MPVSYAALSKFLSCIFSIAAFRFSCCCLAIEMASAIAFARSSLKSLSLGSSFRISSAALTTLPTSSSALPKFLISSSCLSMPMLWDATSSNFLKALSMRDATSSSYFGVMSVLPSCSPATRASVALTLSSSMTTAASSPSLRSLASPSWCASRSSSSRASLSLSVTSFSASDAS